MAALRQNGGGGEGTAGGSAPAAPPGPIEAPANAAAARARALAGPGRWGGLNLWRSVQAILRHAGPQGALISCIVRQLKARACVLHMRERWQRCSAYRAAPPRPERRAPRPRRAGAHRALHALRARTAARSVRPHATRVYTPSPIGVSYAYAARVFSRALLTRRCSLSVRRSCTSPMCRSTWAVCATRCASTRLCFAASGPRAGRSWSCTRPLTWQTGHLSRRAPRRAPGRRRVAASAGRYAAPAVAQQRRRARQQQPRAQQQQQQQQQRQQQRQRRRPRQRKRLERYCTRRNR